jgi:hypothetical protein
MAIAPIENQPTARRTLVEIARRSESAEEHLIEGPRRA